MVHRLATTPPARQNSNSKWNHQFFNFLSLYQGCWELTEKDRWMPGGGGPNSTGPPSVLLPTTECPHLTRPPSHCTERVSLLLMKLISHPVLTIPSSCFAPGTLHHQLITPFPQYFQPLPFYQLLPIGFYTLSVSPKAFSCPYFFISQRLFKLIFYLF